jgi:hypothetical protein
VIDEALESVTIEAEKTELVREVWFEHGACRKQLGHNSLRIFKLARFSSTSKALDGIKVMAVEARGLTCRLDILLLTSHLRYLEPLW